MKKWLLALIMLPGLLTAQEIKKETRKKVKTHSAAKAYITGGYLNQSYLYTRNGAPMT